VLATLVAMTINFTGINLIKARHWPAVLNQVIAVPLTAVMMLIASRQDIMGRVHEGGAWVLNRRSTPLILGGSGPLGT
jgi:hypothetical protein